MDIMMPEMDGREVLRRLRTVKRTPVMMLTARNSVEDRVVGLDLGVDGFQHLLLFGVRRGLYLRQALVERGLIRAANGDKKGAREDFMKVLEKAPNGPAASSARKEIERLELKRTR